MRSTTATPFGKLAVAHGVSVCGDVFFTVALADSLFFSAATSEARTKVLLYLVLTMARLQAASFSASLAAREAGRAFVTADTDADGRARATAAARLAFGDFGFRDDATVTVTCDGSPCLRPEGVVRSDVRIEVPLPLVPDFIADHVPSSVSVSSTHVSSVDRFVAR